MFNLGDIVILKSGGPPMTVCRNISDYGGIKCAWFKDNDEYLEAWFKFETLQAVVTIDV